MRRQELRNRLLLAALMAGGVIALDLVTKRHAALTYVAERRTVIPGVLWFTYTENSGASFSMFEGGGPLLAAAAVVAIAAMAWMLRAERPMFEVVAFGLVIGGAAGNLIDRIARAHAFLDGHVIDWIQFPNFPVFNIADSAITVAVVILFLGVWIHGDDETDENRPQAEAGS